MNVLMIEDNEDDYRLLTRLMEGVDDVQIEWRDTFASGLAYLEAHSVDILLLDMVLPDNHGLAALDTIRTRFSSLPIVILSGNEAEELALEAVRRGAQEYLVKGGISKVRLDRALRYAVERKRLEQRLRESEELYRTIARNYPNGIIVLYDHNLRYTLVDGLGLGELGLSKEQMEGKTIWEIFPSEVAADAEARLRAALAGESFSREIMFAGQMLLVNYVPVRDSDGTILAGMMMTQNVTQWKRAEERFRSLLESAPDAMVIVNMDGIIELVNGQAEYVFGYDRDELVGKPVETLVPEAFRARHTHHRTRYTQDPQLRAMRKELELFALHKDGSQFPVEISLAPIETAEGFLVSSAIREISVRKRVEAALQTSEEQFRSAFDNAAIGMALVSPDGRWLQVNRALSGIIGYTEQELLEKTFQDITHPDDLDIDLTYVRQVLAGEIESYQMEKRYFHKLGHVVWVLLSVSLVRDAQGLPLHFISQIQDITQRKLAETALAAERNLLRTLIDHMPDFVFVKDAAGRFLVSNEAHTKVSGKKVEEIVGRTSLDVYPPELATQYYADDQAVIQSGQPVINAERRTPDPDGYESWGLTTKVPLRDASGQVTGLIGIIRDITERKRMEAALTARMQQDHKFQQHLQALHEITIELTTIDELDAFYRRSVELGLQRLGFDRLALFLYDQKDSVAVGTYGTNAQGTLVSEHQLRFDPLSEPTILGQAILSEERLAFEPHAQLFSDLKPIGTGSNAAAVLWNGTEKLGWLVVDNWVHQQPLDQNDLNILSLYALTLGTLLAQKRTQVAVLDSEKRLSLLAQHSPDMICILDVDEQRAIYLNRPEFLGFTQSDFEHLDLLLQAVHPDDQARFVEHWREITTVGSQDTVSMIEYRLQDRQGQWQWIQNRESVLAFTPDGKPMQILITLTVITERKQAEQQTLELAQEREHVRLLSDFVRDVSHDFRTPLSVINTSLFLLFKSMDMEKRQASFDKAEGQIARLTQLIDRLLIMTRLDGERAFELRPVDLNPLVTAFSTRLGFDARGKRVTIQLSLCDGDLNVQTEPQEFNIALDELGRNAVTYTPPNGTITVRTTRLDDQAVIEVGDTGIGIPDSEAALVFERLYRVDKARSTETGGSGLGLSIARRIVELHHGRIELESVIGTGSTFRIYLPLSQ